MIRSKLLAISVMAIAFVAACDEDDDDNGTGLTAQTFTASLTGAKERPTPRTTPGNGSATFTLSADGNTLSWNVTMTGMNNVFAAHIHVGGPECDCPVGFGIFSSATGVSNPAMSGSVTRAAYTSPLGISFDALLSLMRSGDTYVNVHTNDGVAPTNTGPGDFPGGEIRGQITLSP